MNLIFELLKNAFLLKDIYTTEELYNDLLVDKLFKMSLPEFVIFLDKKESIYSSHNGLVFLRDNKKLQDIFSATWHLTNVLRGVHSVAETRFIVNALLFYKRGFDLDKIASEDSYGIDSKRDEFLNNPLGVLMDFGDAKYWLHILSANDKYLSFEIFQELTNHLHRFSNDQLKQIINILHSIDTTSIDTNTFSLIFENLYTHDVKRDKLLIGTPKNVVTLMTEILQANNGKVYDPVCGRGTFLNEIYREIGNENLYATELHYKTALFAYMSQLVTGITQPNIQVTNCFDTLEDGNTFDYIIADLPILGVVNSDELFTLERHWNIKFPKTKSFSALILFIISKLKDKGRAIFTVSDSFLFKGGVEKKIRTQLIQDDYIEGVISIPNEALKPFTNGKASIIIINKAKPSALIKKIKFLEINSLPFNVLSFAKEYQTTTTLETENVKIIGTDDVLKTTSLEPSTYTSNFYEIKKMLDNGEGVYLHDIVTMRSGQNIKNDDVTPYANVPLVKIENLERDILDIFLSKENIKEFVSYDNFEVRRKIVDTVCILVGKVGDYLKPTIFKPTTQIPYILPHSNVIILELSSNIVTIEYLYYQLYRDFVINQIENNRTRSVIPFISQTRLGEVVIPMVSLEFQEEFIKTQKSEIIASEERRVAERFEKIGYKRKIQESETNIIATLTHQLKHSLTNVRTLITKINHITKNNSLENYTEYSDVNLNTPIIEGLEAPENKTLEETLVLAQREADFLNTILENVQKAVTLELTAEDFTIVSIRSLFDNLLSGSENYKMKLKGEDFDIEVSESHMRELLKGLLNNAVKHSFCYETDKEHTVSFTVKKDRGLAIIRYRNNGLPFNISQKDFVTILSKSRKSNGSGIGGYYIDKIIKAHKGELFIGEDYKSGVFMRIELPLNQHKDE
ncbi:N-6 DNA methylase [uncultured Kordia sp.]|uniref:N-6 DNA methylase n=1 Tax=uncultured Kordia sp. TaxID=507699 RepID=UPI00262EA832|nr:N-6 DNA methylase [uncultured Kordia sp.]